MFLNKSHFELTAILPERNNFWISVFCKSLYGFLILKIVFSWTIIETMVGYSPFTFYSWKAWIIYAPLALTYIHWGAFLVCFLCVLLTSLFFRINYVSSFFICWFSFSFSRLLFPILNGSDLVLNLFLLIAIFMPVYPESKLSDRRKIQETASAIALLLARIQLSLIYFQSGYDKLISEAWRSGSAVYSIMNLDFFYNSFFMVDLTKTAYSLLGWGVIIFELAFALFIWFRKPRLILLIAGMIFHLGIIFILGIIDFGLLMILTYSVFLPLRGNPATVSVNPI